MRANRIGLLLLLSVLILGSFAAGAAPARPAVVEAIVAALRANDPDAAVAAADKAVTSLPSHAEAWHLAAGAYGRMAQAASIFSKLSWAKKCLAAYQKAVELEPTRYVAHLDLMQFYLAAPSIAGGGRDKADAQAARIAGLDVSWGHMARAILARVDKDYARYETEAKAAIAVNPSEMRHRIMYALDLSKVERWADAFAVLDAAQQAAPDDLRVVYQLGRLVAVSGQQLPRGLEALERVQAASIKPEDFSAGGLHWRRGQIHEKLGQKAEALSDYRRALQLEPSMKALVEADIARLQKV